VTVAAPGPVPRPPSAIAARGRTIQKDWHFIGHVEMDRGGDTKIYAQDVWVYTGQNRRSRQATFSFAQGNNRISAGARIRHGDAARHLLSRVEPSSVKPQPHGRSRRHRAAPIPARTRWSTSSREDREDRQEVPDHERRLLDVRPATRAGILHAGTVFLNVDHYTLLKQGGAVGQRRADAVSADPVLPDEA